MCKNTGKGEKAKATLIPRISSHHMHNRIINSFSEGNYVQLERQSGEIVKGGKMEKS